MTQTALSVAVSKAADPFQKINRQAPEHERLIFEREAMFALEIVKASDQLRAVAPESVMNSLIQVAAMRLTLNPTEALCYLIPYGKICYPSPSYRGLVTLATRHKSIQWVQADVVYEQDQFDVELGTHFRITHKPLLKGDRGKRICAYVIWRTASGDLRGDIVPEDELVKMEKAAERKNKGKVTPAYTYWRDEMAKKSAIRRASKLWQKSASLNAAIAVMDKYESGYTIEGEKSAVKTVTPEQLAKLNAAITRPSTLRKMLTALKIEKLDQVPASDFDEVLGRINKHEAALAAKGKKK